MKLNYCSFVPTGDSAWIMPTKRRTAARKLGDAISWVILPVFPSHPGLHSLLTVPVWGLRVQLVAPGSQSLSGPGDSGTCPVKGTHAWPLPLLLLQEMWPPNEAMWSPRGSCPLQEALNGLLPATPEGGCSDVTRGRSGEVKATPKKTVKDRRCPPDADQRIFDCLKTS